MVASTVAAAYAPPHSRAPSHSPTCDAAAVGGPMTFGRPLTLNPYTPAASGNSKKQRNTTHNTNAVHRHGSLHHHRDPLRPDPRFTLQGGLARRRQQPPAPTDTHTHTSSVYYHEDDASTLTLSRISGTSSAFLKRQQQQNQNHNHNHNHHGNGANRHKDGYGCCIPRSHYKYRFRDDILDDADSGGTALIRSRRRFDDDAALVASDPVLGWRSRVPFLCPVRYPELMAYDPQAMSSAVLRATSDCGLQNIASSLPSPSATTLGGAFAFEDAYHKGMALATASRPCAHLAVDRGVVGASLRRTSLAFLMGDARTYPGIEQPPPAAPSSSSQHNRHTAAAADSSPPSTHHQRYSGGSSGHTGSGSSRSYNAFEGSFKAPLASSATTTTTPSSSVSLGANKQQRTNNTTTTTTTFASTRTKPSTATPAAAANTSSKQSSAAANALSNFSTHGGANHGSGTPEAATSAEVAAVAGTSSSAAASAPSLYSSREWLWTDRDPSATYLVRNTPQRHP